MLNPLAQFPTLHPMVVHLPIVLLPLTPLLLLVAWIRRSATLQWTATVLLASGWAGALLASRVYHPHIDVMTLLAQEDMSLHEFWADWTLWLGSAALGILLIQHVPGFRKIRFALRGFALALSLAAALAVAFAGHYGALLTHVHRITVEKE